MKKPPKRPRYSHQRTGDTPQATPEEGIPSQSPLYGSLRRGLRVFPRDIYKGIRERIQVGGLEPAHVLSLSDYSSTNTTQYLRADGTFASIPFGAGLIPATTAVPVTTTNTPGVVTSRYALEDHAHVGINSFGISTMGNTAGDTTVRPGRVVLVGSNITMSQATDATGITITAVGGATATPTGFGVSTAGNTAGNTGTKTGTLVFVGSNIVSLSQATDANGATITLDATAAGGAISVVSKLGVSSGGNTAGNTATTYGQIVLAGMGGNTLSQSTAAGSLATISISAPAIATTVDRVKASSAATVGTVNRYALEDHVHAGVQDAGVSTFGNTAGSTGVVAGRLILVGTSNITLSQSTDGDGATVSFIGASGGAGGAPARSVYENMDGGFIEASVSVTAASLSKRPLLFPCWVDGSVQCKTIEYWGSRAGGTSVNMTHGVAFYTMVNSTSLALYSSTTEGVSLTTSAQFSGVRVYQITGLSNMTLSQGPWVAALYFSGSNNSTAVFNFVIYGGRNLQDFAGSIFAGTNSTGATNVTNQAIPFHGVYSVTTGAWPANIVRTDIAGHSAGVRPRPFIVVRAI